MRDPIPATGDRVCRRRRDRRRARRVDRVDADRPAGHRVQLFERERFPRFHIGESLIPETYWVLKRLNMLPKMQQSHFVKKYSVQFVNSAGRESAPFYFWDNKPHECSQTWQVVRSEFDQMMLENAREHGVDVREGVRVHEVLFEGDRAVGVRIKERRRIVPRGARQGRGRCQRPERPADEQAGAARLGSDPEQGRDLDLLGGRLSRHRPRRGRDAGDPERQQEGLVLVHPAARQHRQRRRRGAVRLPVQGARPTTPQTYEEEVEMLSRREGARRRTRRASTGYFATKDYSYRSKQVAGDGWVLVGDAFGFLDPLYSSGVLLALKSGELAADAVVEGLAGGRHVGGTARQVGRRSSTRASTGCAGWSASTTTASASAR